MGNVQAGPTKEFFIDMITRDIQLEKAILDLIDNSIDGAKNTGVLSDKNILLKIDENRFEIYDNCGGFSIETAKEYAFKFGRKSNGNRIDYSIGRFGVGMKRTLFKLGKNFYIESKTKEEHFRIEVDIEKWKEEENWEFNLEEMDYVNDGWTGTKIIVTNLYADIAKSFAKENLNYSSLEYEIGYSYATIINNGMNICLNDKLVEGKNILMLNDYKIMPACRLLKIGNVDVTILAGISDALPNEAGWYVYGNDRLLLIADKTKVTGWGSKNTELSLPQFHPTYAMFRGVVFMSSKNVVELPLTTTKVGVDIDSEIYRAILYNMGIMMKEVFSYIKQTKSKEEREEICDLHAKEIVFNIRDKYIETKVSRCEFKFEVELNEDEDLNTRITYNKPKDEVERLKKELNLKNNRELGEFTYEYYIDMECM